jgi:hypothetical protein
MVIPEVHVAHGEHHVSVIASAGRLKPTRRVVIFAGLNGQLEMPWGAAEALLEGLTILLSHD